MEFTLMEDLWFGDAGDDSAEEAAAQSLVAQVDVIYGLRPFPISAQQLMTLIKDPNYTIDAVEKIIESDPILAARVMRVVNSAAYGLRTQCKSLGHAVVMLGATSLSEIATAMAVLDTVQSSTALMKKLQRHSVAVGSISRQLAIELGKPPAEIFTCGLLHDLGKMLSCQVEEDTKTGGERTYGALLERCDGPDTAHIAEREARGYDHAVLAAHLMRAWQIPEPVPMVVAKHHQFGVAMKHGDETATMTSLVCLADRLSYCFEDPDTPAEEQIEEVVKTGPASYIELSAGVLKKMWKDLQDAYVESRSVLS